MFTVAITLMNGHSINVGPTTKDYIDNLVQRLFRGPVVAVNQRSGELVYIFADKVAYVTVYEEAK